MTRIAINGYGRVGRCVLRAIHQRGLRDRLEIIAINDLANPELMVHLTRFDSTHGYFDPSVTWTDGALWVDGRAIAVSQQADPVQLRWRELDIDLVLECSGKFKKRSALVGHLDAGAPRVLASHPVEDADKTVVYGVNHHELTGAQRIISNASCTTNCLAPLVKILHEAIGIEHGAMTTVHSYTNDQQLLDKTHGDAYRSRAAVQSVIPTRTGAAAAIGLVMPELAGKLSGMALRVPTPNVSLIDLHFTSARHTSVAEINDLMRAAAAGGWRDIVAYNDLPLVSIDFNHHPASCIFDANHTGVHGRQIKVMAWYDNEWGFANRMVDMALYLTEEPAA